MTRNEVIVRAIAKEITWIQVATICGITARHMRRRKERYEKYGPVTAWWMGGVASRGASGSP